MIRRNLIYLRGAYGPGNFGDDLLMISMLNFLDSFIQKENITVSIENPTFISKSYPNVKTAPINAPVFSKIAILGGGGQFFAFKGKRNRPASTSFFKRLISLFNSGYLMSDLFFGFILRKLYGLGYKAEYYSWFCIGFGPFYSDFTNERLKMVSTNPNNLVFVRDHKSGKVMKKQLGHIPEVFSDISFSSQYWLCDSVFKVKRNYSKNTKKCVGVVIRQWEFENSVVDLVDDVIRFTKENSEYDYIYILLDKRKDIGLIEKYGLENYLIWDINNFSISEFCKILKENVDLIVSSRAHGVLVPTICHIPCISLEIEPKLKAVHDLLPNSTWLISENNFTELKKNIEYILSISNEDLYNLFLKDLNDNISKSNESFVRLRHWIDNILQNEA